MLRKTKLKHTRAKKAPRELKMFTKNFIDRFGNLLTIVLGKENKNSPYSKHVLKILNQFVETIESRVKTRGKVESLNFFKSVYLIATKVAMERPFEPIPFCKSNKDGIPNVLSALLPYLTGSADEKRIGLSIAKLYLAIVLPASTDFSSITTPGVDIGEDSIFGQKWSKFLIHWTKKFGTPDLSWDGEWKATTKNGPNGHALVFAHQDSVALSRDNEVQENLLKWLELSSPLLKRTFLKLQAKWKGNNNNVESKHSRLGLISEYGGKTRQIAMADYFTKESLKSIFQWSMRCLKKLDTDGTYNQQKIVEKTRQAIVDGKPIHCLDLSSATDRFPVKLQYDLLVPIIGETKAAAWRDLLVKRDFYFSTGDVRYAVGQPMGILSSWSIFSLTHHAFIEYIASLEGYRSFRDYVVLGDDVAIFNTKVSDRYLSEMSNLGVGISLPKSYHWVPSDSFPPSAEIAKRLLYKEEEITPIPFKLANTWAKRPVMEALALRFSLLGLGIVVESQIWETLSKTILYKDRMTFLLLTQSPMELLRTIRTLRAQEIGVTQGVWEGVDFSQLPEVMEETLKKSLELKQAQVWEIHQAIFYEGDESGKTGFWSKFKDKGGEPISFSVLGMGSIKHDEIHPVMAVISNRLNRLWEIEEALSADLQDPDDSKIDWIDVLNADYSLAQTFVSDEKRLHRIQTQMVLKIFNLLKSRECPRTEV